MDSLPIFPVTTVGSWPRPPLLLKAQRAKQRGQLNQKEFSKLADEAVLQFLRLQEDVGVDLLTDGEQRRDNFYSFVAEKLEGVRLMTLSQLLDVIEDKAGFERILQTLDVPAYSISNATCVGKIKRRQPLAVEELRFAKSHTSKPVKVTLPGPYLLTRSMYVPSVSSKSYASKESLGEDIVQVLRDEVQQLVQEGADFIQFDEPVLTELVFTQGQTRTFMCAALAARKDPVEELEFAVSLLNRVVFGVNSVRIGLHVCRGNWSQNESTLLRGSYHPLLPYLERMNVCQLVLEYATERAGGILKIGDKELGLGVVNPRTDKVESDVEISNAVHRALGLYSHDKIWLNPDCGFGTFSNRPVNSPDTARKKLEGMVDAARRLRQLYG